MTDILADHYPWTKALHIMSVIAWMAGLFYLPRLFVYHVEAAQTGDSRDEMFQIMERRLLRAIMNPAMIATWVFGLLAGVDAGHRRLVVDLALDQGGGRAGDDVVSSLAGRRSARSLPRATCTVSGRSFRMMNEVPTLLLIVIVVSVVLKF